ncbi:MAG: MarC family protein [Victivallales bacterium]|nr:MarC family protein [Victivallales bacterium]
MSFIVSTAILLFLVMDPFGNIPFFVEELKEVPPEHRRTTIFREAVIALGVLLLFLVAGGRILAWLQISRGSLGIAGGVILFLIAMQMVFGSAIVNQKHSADPFIVPLAIPMIAGPSAITTVILVSGKSGASLLYGIAALVLAWLPTTLILMFAHPLAKWLGKKAVDASESLMGLLLTGIAVEMLVNGIKASFFQ